MALLADSQVLVVEVGHGALSEALARLFDELVEPAAHAGLPVELISHLALRAVVEGAPDAEPEFVDAAVADAGLILEIGLRAGRHAGLLLVVEDQPQLANAELPEGRRLEV